MLRIRREPRVATAAAKVPSATVVASARVAATTIVCVVAAAMVVGAHGIAEEHAAHETGRRAACDSRAAVAAAVARHHHASSTVRLHHHAALLWRVRLLHGRLRCERIATRVDDSRGEVWPRVAQAGPVVGLRPVRTREEGGSLWESRCSLGGWAAHAIGDRLAVRHLAVDGLEVVVLTARAEDYGEEDKDADHKH